MEDICADLLAEYSELADLAAALTPQQWSEKSLFYGWTPWDEIAHLCYFDEQGLLAATDEAAFAAATAELTRRLAAGQEMSAIARQHYGHLGGAELLAYWRREYGGLVGALAARGPKDRLPWYGPSMSARSFATARLMETWAHGQDIHDVMRRRRRPSPRLKHIAHLGVTTFGWTFVNRKLPVPQPAPYVELAAPGGGQWSWNEPSAEHYVRGTAEDFCLVVTQRRNVADTGLEVGGEPARQWLAIAQCFAGPPADGPAPGRRVVAYAN